MLDLRKLNHFYYSQNSLNTFNRCPLKFKYKYLDNINWKKDSLEDEEYYEGMKTGLDFHLLCERYFSGIPEGVEKHKEEYKDLYKWLNAVKRQVPFTKENLYFTEYEIRMKKDSMKLQAKYDLIILKANGDIEIWDWKTENRRLKYTEMEKRLQTIVYMYVLGEKLENIFHVNGSLNKITMNFYQPEFEEKPITITYNIEKHLSNENKLKKLIQRLENFDFEKDFTKELYDKNCKYCEFNNLCNNEKTST